MAHSLVNTLTSKSSTHYFLLVMISKPCVLKDILSTEIQIAYFSKTF